MRLAITAMNKWTSPISHVVGYIWLATKAAMCLMVFLFSACRELEESHEIFYADPTIYVEDGKYYLTGTRNREPYGFPVLESTNLRGWRTPNGDSLQLILKQGDHTFGERGFWAPQIFKAGDTYYLTHTANEQTVLTRSNSLLGPYRQKKVAPIDGSEKNIDSYVFKDGDKYYLYHVRFDNGNYLWVAEFDITKGEIKPATLTKCFGQTQNWEATPNYQSNPIMEGPTVVKKEGKYYLFYSANHFMSIDYSVGYAVADSPLGPWSKHQGNPIIHRSIAGENGSGHGDLFVGLDGQLYYVYHVHHSPDQVKPRRTRIVPLKQSFSDKLGYYDFTVDGEEVIIPMQLSKPEDGD